MAEEIKVPAGIYDMVTRCMEQEFPDNVAIRYVAADGKTVVEKKYREYAQDIRRMTAYLKAEVPGIKGQRVALLSRNSYEYCVASFGIILAGGVLVTLNQKKMWEELEYELGLVEPALILNDGIDYGCRAELEAAYGPKLRPMDCYRNTAPGELTNCIGHDDLMMLMFTSGTTGRSKGVMLSERNMCTSLCTYGARAENWITSRLPEGQKLPLSHMTLLPLFHMGLLRLRYVLPARRLGTEPLQRHPRLLPRPRPDAQRHHGLGPHAGGDSLQRLQAGPRQPPQRPVGPVLLLCGPRPQDAAGAGPERLRHQPVLRHDRDLRRRHPELHPDGRPHERRGQARRPRSV